MWLLLGSSALPPQIPVLFLHCWALLPDFFSSCGRRAGGGCIGALSSKHNHIPLASDQMGLSATVFLLPGCLVKANHHNGTMDSSRPIGGVSSGCFPGGKSNKITKIWIPSMPFSLVHDLVDVGCFNNDVVQYPSRIEVIKPCHTHTKNVSYNWFKFNFNNSKKYFKSKWRNYWEDKMQTSSHILKIIPEVLCFYIKIKTFSSCFSNFMIFFNRKTFQKSTSPIVLSVWVRLPAYLPSEGTALCKKHEGERWRLP